MTNEELQAHIAAVRKAFDDHQIEGLYGGLWVDLANNTGINFASQYRIKPQPREVWICKARVQKLCNGMMEQAVVLHDPHCPPLTDDWVRFREVIE